MRFRFASLAGAVLTLSLAATSSLAAQAAAATMPICKDGSTSSVAGRGACSGHGGVDAKATDAAKKAAAKAAKTAKAAATADKAADKTAKASATAAKADAKAADKSADAAKTTAKATDKAADNAAKSAKAADKSADKAAGAAKTKTASTKSDNTDPTNATAQCKDGTYSHAKTHQGACSNHGGVAKFLK
jgi:hypothetical protein